MGGSCISLPEGAWFVGGNHLRLMDLDRRSLVRFESDAAGAWELGETERTWNSWGGGQKRGVNAQNGLLER